MQNINEFIQVSKVLLNNLIHSSSFGRNCALWLMYWVRQKMHSWSHLRSIHNCQKTAHRPFPREPQAEVDFIWVNVTTEMGNKYLRQGQSQTRMLTAENRHKNSGALRTSHNPCHFQMCQKAIFQMWYGGGGKGWEGKQQQQKKPTGMKTQVPADTMKKISQLMKWVCNSHAQARKFSKQV